MLSTAAVKKEVCLRVINVMGKIVHQQKVDMLVNSAIMNLRFWSVVVAGAIHSVAGPELWQYAANFPHHNGRIGSTPRI
jgi:O-acetyl-ADP-ribose deacetylase (regulator of RNase III)